jgi:hypothetical protein
MGENRLEMGPTMIAKRPPPESLPQANKARPDPGTLVDSGLSGPRTTAPTAAILAGTTRSADDASAPCKTPTDSAASGAREMAEPDSTSMRNSGHPDQPCSLDNTQPLDRLKSIFAVIGLIAVIFHSLRLLGSLHAE